MTTVDRAQCEEGLEQASGGWSSVRLSELVAEFDTARRTVALLRGERAAAVLVIALGVVSAGLEVVGLSLLIPLVGIALEQREFADLPVLGSLLGDRFTWTPGPTQFAMLAGVAMLSGIAVSWANSIVSNRLAMRAGDDLRRRTFEAALRRPIAEIEAMPDGRLPNVLAAETWRVGDALFTIIGAAVQAITAMIFLTALVMLSPALVLALLLLAALTAAVVHLVTRTVKTLGAQAVAANEAFMAELWDALGGLRLIRAFGAEEGARRRFGERSGEVREVFTRLGVLSAAIKPVTQSLTIVTIGALLAAAMWLGEPVEVTVGFLAITYRMQPRLMALLQARTALRGFDAAVRSVTEIVTTAESAAVGGAEFRRVATRPATVRLEKVGAVWPGASAPSTQEIDCVFRAGEITALTGASGAGKSTIAAVLLGFLAPASGRVLIDDTPLDALDAREWRRRVAYVDQSAHLFNMTLRENIAFDGDPRGVEDAARAADAHDFITGFAQGYDTNAGQRRLSSGQRQRVALARALARRPWLVVLDEATNALDLPTERAIAPALRRLADDGCIVIVIAHRREAVAFADHAVVVEKGRIVEKGSPAALFAAGGAFARLYSVDEQAAAEPDDLSARGSGEDAND
jgi:subfamily B ATP-binding cassette protein MsbA